MSVYATDGSYRVTIVDGGSLTGLYAPDGSFNIVPVEGDIPVGLYHPCGAYNVVVQNPANKLNNPTFLGADIGTDTLPDAWSIFFDNQGTLAFDVTEDTPPVFGYQITGTSSGGAGSIDLQSFSIYQIEDQEGTFSVELRLADGDLTNVVSTHMGIIYLDSSSSFVDFVDSEITLTNTFTRYSITDTAPAGAFWTVGYIRVLTEDDEAVDLTIEVRNPVLYTIS